MLYLVPRSHLHLWNEISASGGVGSRPWMDIGVYMHHGIASVTDDNMYVGLKHNPGTGQTDAIINWGNNPTSLITLNIWK